MYPDEINPYAAPPAPAPPPAIATIGNNSALTQAIPVPASPPSAPVDYGVNRVTPPAPVPYPSIANAGKIPTVLSVDDYGNPLSQITPTPPPVIATTPPSTRAQGTPSTPNAAPAAPVDPNAPVVTDPNSPLLLNRQLASATNAAGSDPIARGNAGIRSLAANPNTFNDVQAANGSGISATSANGQLTINGVAATQPQPFTQGYDLAANNAKMRASLDAGYASDRKAQIADLTQQLNNSNAPPGSPRAQALISQIAALSNIDQTIQDSKGGLESAQANLANAQAKQIGQATQVSAEAQKQLNVLHDQFINEKNPTKQKEIGDKILTLAGKDPRADQYQVINQTELSDPNNPYSPTLTRAAILDKRSGLAQTFNDAVANGVGGKSNSPTPPAGYKQVGMAPNGKPVYQGPDGKRVIAQ